MPELDESLRILPLLSKDLPQSGFDRIIHVTHQLPFEISRTDNDDNHQWSFAPRRGHGAMYAGIESLKNEWKSIHIGWTGEIHGQPDAETNNKTTLELAHDDKERLAKDLEEAHGCIPLYLDSESVAGHYDGYCKTMLWPLFHYLIWNDATDGRLERKQWEAYAMVNRKYAELVCQHYREGDIIWVHDYHLLLVPGMVREKLPKARIGLFIHAPFPSSEIFRCLPKRQEILKGMLGANLVGFQTYSYARHFISTCTRIFGYESNPDGVEEEDHFCHVGTFPIGIDVDRVETMRKDKDVQYKMKAIADMYTGKKIIVGRDKLDLVKGVLQKLAAFEKFLMDYPEWRNQVVLIQVTDGSTTESAKLENKVSEIVAHINGTYGSLEFTPVHHYHHQVQPDDLYALLSIADAALITAVRDGMNTTSLEYVICQQEKHGPLILSEFTGTAGSMSSALMVNPWDYAGLAKAINDALLMSEEDKLSRHLQLLDHVKSHTASFWAHSFIKLLVQSIASSEQTSNTPVLRMDYLLPAYQQSKRRLLCFDYDGTLTPICKTPSAAVPPPDMLRALEKLCQDPRNDVWVISGRDETALDRWLGHIDGIGLSAEHGCFIKYPHSDKWINLTEHVDMGWKHDVIDIFTYYTERTTGSFIEHKRCSITWHYRLADPEYGAFQAKECQNHLENAILSKLPVEVLVGKKNLEVRPTSINKGEVVNRLLAAHHYDFVMCCGDDKTDEDMFKKLRKAQNLTDDQIFSVMVGSEDKKTRALWRLQNVQEVIDTIARMADSS
ncbi:trehalose 6-phosphate phosphatase [Lichtheimia corymbifera JMRC:FSU:9682]|uniref:Trehalose 6-phosphate phosphatase n=1 Tax=Lichtheimia corymbifera JMRC:FSU:9682 TaxID=1263082 RepID=A0A068RMH1_9FUNG|nr:trehalose 6-phosphate phosphatase [Lichtheimia corymbifera JMRC:FSU:9682]